MAQAYSNQWVSVFIVFRETYADRFQLKTREIGPQAQQYLCGLMQSNRKNMERMAEVVPESDEQALQHFLSNSNWGERAVLDQVALEADQQLGADLSFLPDIHRK